MKPTLLLAAGALALGALAAGCAGLRSTAMSWSNDDLVGDAAPALDSGEWVAAEVWQAQAPTADWRLLVVFRPT